MLAKNVNDNVCLLNKPRDHECFSSKLAPTTGYAYVTGMCAYNPPLA